jgi:rubrerythrin
MQLGSIFLLLAVFVLVALFVARPFLERRRVPTGVRVEDHERSSLLAERDRLIGALQELDFDQTLGKIPTEDYPAMRSDLLQKAAEVLRRLDLAQPQVAGVNQDAQARVEAAVAARRADAAEAAHGFSDDELEDLLAARRAAHKEKSGGFCPNCGKPILRSDRFCPSCGKSVK